MTAAVILLVIGTSIWVGFDSRSRDWSHSSFANKPWQWVVGCLLLWIVVFPLYLVKRGQAGGLSQLTQAAPPLSTAQPPPGWTAEQMAAVAVPTSPTGSGGGVSTLTGVFVIVGFVVLAIVVLTAMSGTGDSTPSPSLSASAPSGSASPVVQASSDPPHVLASLSGSGIGHSPPFQINSDSVTVNYSYDCTGFGYDGNFIGDVESSADDQSFANELGPSGSTETTVYPTDQGGEYHITVNSECDWNVTVTGS